MHVLVCRLHTFFVILCGWFIILAVNITGGKAHGSNSVNLVKRYLLQSRDTVRAATHFAVSALFMLTRHFDSAQSVTYFEQERASSESNKAQAALLGTKKQVCGY